MEDNTYSIPVMKTPRTCSFLLKGSCRRSTGLIGNIRMNKSSARLSGPVSMSFGRAIFMHLDNTWEVAQVPVAGGAQKYA